ncbi:MAG: hypothetical protein AAGC72_00425 [Planctomycetota bacterium]
MTEAEMKAKGYYKSFFTNDMLCANSTVTNHAGDKLVNDGGYGKWVKD